MAGLLRSCEGKVEYIPLDHVCDRSLNLCRMRCVHGSNKFESIELRCSSSSPRPVDGRPGQCRDSPDEEMTPANTWLSEQRTGISQLFDHRVDCWQPSRPGIHEPNTVGELGMV